MQEKVPMKQIIFKVTADTHKLIKVFAATRGISMNLWLMRAIYRALNQDQRL